IRRPDTVSLRHHGSVPGLSGFSFKKLELRVGTLGPAGDLPRPDVGGKELRASANHLGPDHGSPRMTEHDDAVSLEAPAKVFSELDSVVRHSLECEIWRAV